MGQRQVSADIDAPPERVFDLYTDAQRVGDWQTGVKSVEATGSLAQVGSEWTVRYGGPFAVQGTFLDVERPVRHRQRFSELMGLVSCTTTASFVRAGGERDSGDLRSGLPGRRGPIGRLFDGMLGGEIVGRFKKDLAGLKAIAEQ